MENYKDYLEQRMNARKLEELAHMHAFNLGEKNIGTNI